MVALSLPLWESAIRTFISRGQDNGTIPVRAAGHPENTNPAKRRKNRCPHLRSLYDLLVAPFPSCRAPVHHLHRAKLLRTFLPCFRSEGPGRSALLVLRIRVEVGWFQQDSRREQLNAPEGQLSLSSFGQRAYCGATGVLRLR